MIGVRGDGYNVSRGAVALADGKLGKARTATIRRQTDQHSRPAGFSAGTYALHLPANSRRETPFMIMFDNILAPAKAA